MTDTPASTLSRRFGGSLLPEDCTPNVIPVLEAFADASPKLAAEADTVEVHPDIVVVSSNGHDFPLTLPS
ncbi:hypothetical protein [Curtobacterium sp. MCSS17_016]|uniref:hypothetical protein n=1 Tax=Curtobacterium sp. MCSS17_016 TaxID=2175644 RepID=UPI0011B4A91F|nr:hypothetical protein [Curtobacterium sp. MCSS17_016]WIE81142.1 hypothetical protein DEJ19_021945 [Curtobacterium sp. MCSS17_016]